MATERLYINNIYIPLSQGLNPSITKKLADITEPDKRKGSYSKSIVVPRSKEADIVFNRAFEINAKNATYNTEAKAPVRYEVDSINIIQGYVRLNKIVEQDGSWIGYEITMFNEVCDFFSDIKDALMTELYASTSGYEGLDIYDHSFTKEIQQLSWDTEIIINGSLEPFDYGKGYVYALVDFGFSQNATDFIFTQIGCSIYELEYMLRIVSWAGYTIKAGGFFDTDTIFDHLIIPASPECYQLTAADITAREFAANTPEFDSTGTTDSNNLPIGSLSSPDIIIFTNDSVAPAFDPGLNYDPATGEFTAVYTGVYSLTALIDIQATFDPTSGSAVKTICDIHGYLMFWHTPIATGVPVQIDALPFYLTKVDSSFYSGNRTTSSTPTYPDADYMSGKAWGKNPQSTPVARAVNPPDRYQLTTNGVGLMAGDIITVQWKAGIFCESVFTSTYSSSNLMFIDSLGNKSSGSAFLTISVGAFSNKVSNLTMSEGNELQIIDVIPQQVKMIDYFMSNVRRFNLVVDTNPLNPKELIIETRDNYLSGDVLNIHELIDVSKDIEYTPTSSLNVKQYYYGYKPDQDYWNQRYSAQHQGEIYGERKVEVVTEFTDTVKKTEVIFSPTPSVGLPNNDRVLPTIYTLNDYGQPVTTKFNIRSLYYGGLKPCLNGWNHTNYVSVFGIPLTDTFVEYPYSGHWDDPFDPTLDISFGIVKEVFYDDNINTVNWTDNNLVNKYHGKFLREITDPDSKIVKAYVHLKPLTYYNFTFDKLYYFKFAYFRLLSVEGYNPTSEETTLCTFLKINNAGEFTATTRPLTGKPGYSLPTQDGGNVDMGETSPSKGVRASEQPDNNNYTTRSVDVKGYNNYIAPDAKNIEIYGDSNRVWHEATNIKIHGSGNTIDAGVSNVVLINTNDLVVTESDVVYVNGAISTGGYTSGIYTPTLYNTTNIAASTAYECQYFQVNDMVTVTGKVDVDPTAAGLTQLGIDLPAASNLGAAEDCAGVAFAPRVAAQGAAIIGSAANNRAIMEWIAVDVTNQPMYFTFTYQII
jgi:hypothetical protein